MKILVVSQFYYPEPFRLNEICEELVQRGHDVTVLTANPSYPDGYIYNGYANNDNTQILNGVRVLRCKSRPRYKGTKNLALNYLSFFYNAERRLKRLACEYDIVYTYQLSPVTSSIPAVRYAKRNRIPCVLYCLDIWPESVINFVPAEGIAFKAIKKMSQYAYKNSTKVLVTSPSFSKYIGELCNINVDDIKCIPQHSKDIGSVETDKKDDVLNFMFLGNIGEAQFVDGIIKATSKIDSKKPFKVHIVGSGSELDNVRLLADELKMGDRIIFHGRQPKEKMPEYYKMADVCIVSLINEGVVGYTIPGKLQEYMSAAKPILASIDGDAQEVISDAQCGLCSKADDVEGLKANMECFLNLSRSELDAMGANSRNYYDRHFTLEKHIDELEREFKQLINK